MVDAGNAGWKLMIVIYASACALHVQLRWRNIGHGGIVHMQYAEKVEEIESGKDHVVLMRDSFIVASSILHLHLLLLASHRNQPYGSRFQDFR